MQSYALFSFRASFFATFLCCKTYFFLNRLWLWRLSEEVFLGYFLAVSSACVDFLFGSLSDFFCRGLCKSVLCERFFGDMVACVDVAGDYLAATQLYASGGFSYGGAQLRSACHRLLLWAPLTRLGWLRRSRILLRLRGGGDSAGLAATQLEFS